MEIKNPELSTKQQKIQKQKPVKKTDANCLQIIKKMNGFKDSVWKEMDKIQTIQLVLEDFGSMIVVNRFKGIKSLTLINVGISVIEGLNQATKLQQLWLNENTITKLQGLQKCYNLRSLYISHNGIKKIEGLDNLTKLQTLWLCDNKIENLQNLQRMTSIKQLWIAGNQIEYIKTSLDSLISLVDLNLSGNKICSFKEALNLNRLPNLKILSFYDPHFGENPICNLCNYQTYVLYHLRNINKLDTLMISQEAKTFAESTFMRKKMYYNMRIKTMQRSFSTLSKLIKKASKIKLDGVNEDLANLFLKINQLDEQAKEVIGLKQIYNLKIEQLNHIRTVYESMKKRLFETDKVCIRKLITQLETGGNIRLEEGKPSQKWFMSCVDLIKSRFQPADLQHLGISDINVKRVIRIHNRFLKNKFQEKMQALVDVSNANYKKLLQYLFFGVDPNAPSQMEHVIQEGFRPAAQSKKLGLCPYTPLVNSLLGADLPRLLSYIKNKKNEQKFNKQFIKKRNLGNLVTFPSGSILICKVLMLKNSVDNSCPYFNPQVPPSQIFQSHPIQSKDPTQYAIFRVKQNQSRHKIWFILDNNLVLPQYLVEFDYVLDNANQNKVSDFGDSIALLETHDDEFISPRNINTYLKDINQIYNALVLQVSNYQFQNIQQNNHPNLQIQANDLDRIDIGVIKIMLANYFKYCLNRSNAYYQLNDNLLSQTTQQFDFKKIKIGDPSFLKYANLSNLKIKQLSFLKSFNNLEIAILSYNSITKLTDLQQCVNIKSLDLSHNQITQILGLSSLTKLEYIDLSHNQITSIQTLRILELNSKLKQINVLFNPFTSAKGLQLYLYKVNKTLKCINHKPLSKLQSIQQNDKQLTEISDDMIRENSKMMQSKTINQNNWRLTIETLNLTHSKIVSLKGLEKLVNLRQINLGHNSIEVIDYINNCKLMEELNLQRNHINKIQKLEGLIYLKKLQLGKNRITKVEGISTLNNLMQLSLQDNLLNTLQDFPQLKSLMELYLGNNKISDSKEIKNLKDLQKLIILDMSGNPLSKDSSYRIYTLYILKKLKVLDGISIEMFQLQQAKQHFTGRLTQQILKDKLEGRKAQQVAELDLSNCKLKDFEEMFNHKLFPHLVELNLSGNQFMSVKMLGFLPNLKILILQSNKIQTLYYNSDPTILKGLNGCQNLQIIDLSNNCLKDFNGLQFCKLGELKILKASRNELYKIDNLQTLKQLKQLDVNHNKIKQFDINSFEGKNPIKCLKIDDNGLKNFNNIQKLVKLQHLFANSNRINQFHDIDKLCQLIYLKQIELNGNSLYRKPGYRSTLIKKLPNLIYLDGREITPEERTDPQTIQKTSTNVPPIYIPQLNQKQVPVRLSSVNFEGVFTSNRLGMQSLLSQNLYSNNGNNQQPPKKF